MLKRLSMALIIIIIMLLIPVSGISQVAKITPEKPQWGDKLQVTYDPTTEAAKFLPGDEIYAICFVFSSDSTERRWAKMQKDGGVFKYVMPIEKDMAFLTFYFLTLEDWDRNAEVSTMIYRQDGLPRRGGNIRLMKKSSTKENYLDFFKKEIELYPDNYSAYRDKWLIQRIFGLEDLKNTITQDIDLLEKQLKDDSVGLLYSLSYGYLELGEEKKSNSILRIIIEKYPHSYYAGQALNYYENQLVSNKIKDKVPEEVERLKLQLIEKSPGSRYSRDKVRSLARQMEAPLSLVERVCENWIRDEPNHPWPHFYLAMAYSERKEKLIQASELINQAINLLLKGKLRLYEDHTGIMTKIELPWYYEVSSDIHYQLGNYAKALADIKAAKLMQVETRPGYYLKEAIIWQKVEAYSKAEQECLEALMLGSHEAENFLKEIYSKRHGSVDGFQAYLSIKTKKITAEHPKEKEIAPDFNVVTLEGEKLRLAEMKGKAVVLNFWYIGCAPCRVEIPGFNKLIEVFKGENVVFIAFALDKEHELKEFLKRTPFNYKIIPSALTVAKQFGVKVFPTHIIISKEGKIEHTLIGGSENRHEQLEPLIHDVLR